MYSAFSMVKNWVIVRYSITKANQAMKKAIPKLPLICLFILISPGLGQAQTLGKLSFHCPPLSKSTTPPLRVPLPSPIPWRRKHSSPWIWKPKPELPRLTPGLDSQQKQIPPECGLFLTCWAQYMVPCTAMPGYLYKISWKKPWPICSRPYC